MAFENVTCAVLQVGSILINLGTVWPRGGDGLGVLAASLVAVHKINLGKLRCALSTGCRWRFCRM